MKLFLDTSSLFKLYYAEAGTEIIEDIFINNKVTTVFLSELTKIEFASTVWKSVKTGLISEIQAKSLLQAWDADKANYFFVPVDTPVVDQAKFCIEKYGVQGLRTLDSIQLATAVQVKQTVDLFISSDNLLNSFLQKENLPVLMT